jgi:hypothetical protein
MTLKYRYIKKYFFEDDEKKNLDYTVRSLKGKEISSVE